MATEQEYGDILQYKRNTSKYRSGLSENGKTFEVDRAATGYSITISDLEHFWYVVENNRLSTKNLTCCENVE